MTLVSDEAVGISSGHSSLSEQPYDLPPRRFSGWSCSLALPVEEFPAGLEWPSCLELPAEPKLTIVANRSTGLGRGRRWAQDPEDVASELMVGVTVVAQGEPAILLLGGWIDNPISLLFGRELFGFPKRHGRILTSAVWPLREPRAGDEIWMSVVERGHPVGELRGRVGSAQDASAARAAGGRFLSWRRIPAADGSGTVLSELLEARSRLVSLAGAWDAVVDLALMWWPDRAWAAAVTGRHDAVSARYVVAERELDWARRIWCKHDDGS